MLRAYRNLSRSIILAVVLTIGLVGLDPGASAQVRAPHAAPALVEEVGRLVSRHFYDRGAVERVWADALAVHSAALPADPTSDEVAAALDAMLAELGASHTGRYTPSELAYYELLDIFARDECAPRRGGAGLPGRGRARAHPAERDVSERVARERAGHRARRSTPRLRPDLVLCPTSIPPGSGRGAGPGRPEGRPRSGARPARRLGRGTGGGNRGLCRGR